MDKMRMESVDITDQNIDKIANLFPSCITEAKDENGKLKKAINFDMLRQLLSKDVAEGDEAYEFTWVGKKNAIVEANTPIRKTLRPCKEESVNWDTTENLYIEGDNLEVLKLLQESYLGKVKMIYIDPPYNTGNDFIYNDDFKSSSEEYAEDSGAVDENGDRMFKNTDSNGRFHSDWCSMIYSRLSLARNLLANDGVIFISIDDNEQENLKKICDEVFGYDSFVANLHVQMSTTQGMKVKAAKNGNIVKNGEFILCYSKDGRKNIATHPLYDLRPKYDSHYSLFLKEDGTIAQLSEFYDYRFPKDLNNKKPLKIEEAYAKSAEFAEIVRAHLAEIVRAHLAEIVRADKITFNNSYNLEKGKWTRVELSDREYLLTLDKNGKMIQLMRLSDSWGQTDDYKKSVGLRKIRGDWWSGFYLDMGNVSKEGNITFPNGKKPIRLIKQIIKMVTDKDDTILDFFSGSATTAHAVMRLNAEDGGNRKFVMVQLPEACDEKSEAYKAGYKNICEIGKERIRRAGAQIKNELETAAPFEKEEKETGIAACYGDEETKAYGKSTADKLDIGFRVLKVADSNMTDVYYSADDYSQNMLTQLESNIKPDRSDMDLLFGCLLEWGLPLSMLYTSETIEGCTVHTYNDGDLIACFDESIPDEAIKEIAKRQPLRAVFRDSSFKNSPSKINVTEIFKMLSPDTSVKVI